MSLTERAAFQPVEKSGTTTVAPPGKRCSQCLCCEAIIAFDGEYLCDLCDAGTHPAAPEIKRAQAPPLTNEVPSNVYSIAVHPEVPARKEFEAALMAHGAQVCTAIQTAAAPPLLEKGDSPMHPSGVGKKHEISDEIKAAVLASPTSELNGSLARKLGISAYKVSVIREKAGIRSTAKPGGVSISSRKEKTSRAKTTVPEPERASWPVEFEVSQKQLDAWWKGLPLDLQAGIFAANFTFDPAAMR
jgi:hypothetical protein